MGVCDVPIISTVCDVAGEAAATLVSAPFDWLAAAIGKAAGWMFEAVWSIFDTTTLVDVTSKEYVGVYNILFGVAVFIMLLFFFLQLITGLVHRDPSALSRAALGLAKSVLGSFIAITLTGTLLEITDQLCVGIVQATGTTMEQMGDKIALLAAGLTGINIAAPGVGAIITIFLAGLAITAACIVWFSLLIRKALLLVAVVFAPIALAGSSWDITKGWFGKWASFVIALVLSKLVLVVVFLVAVTQVSKPIDADLASISDPIAGIVLMFIAAFAPYMTYKFISFIGFDMYHAMSSEQEAKQALNRPIPTLTKPQGAEPKKVLDGQSNDTGGGGGDQTPPPPGAPTPSPAPGLGELPAAAETAAPAASATSGTATTAGAGAGPVGLAVAAGATVVMAAADAGPRLGNAVGETADQHASAAAETTTPPPPASAGANTPPPAGPGQPTPPPPSTPPATDTPAAPPAGTE